MCRHCERLVEDACDKELVHAFMARTAEKVNRRLRLEGRKERVTADELDVRIDVCLPVRSMPSPVLLKIRKDLEDMDK